MKATIVAAVSGLLLGHALWLIAIFGVTRANVATVGLLVIAAVVAAVAAIAGFVGLRSYRAKAYPTAGFLWALPVSPVLFTISALGVTYL